MRYITHLSAALFIYLNMDLGITLLMSIIIGSLLPDIDLPGSKLGKYFRPFNYLMKHRGFTHGLLFIMPLLIMSWIFLDRSITLGLAIGIGSHIFLDMLTPKGVMILHPLSKIRLRGPIRTGSIGENVLLTAFLAADVLLIIL